MTTRPIELPLVQGRHDEIDRQLLPQGMLSAAENYRIAKTGKLVRREGYTHTATDCAPGIFVGCGDIYLSERGSMSSAIDYVPRLMRLGDRRLCYAETYGRDDTTVSNGGQTLLLERTANGFQAVTPVEYPTYLLSAAMTSPLSTAPLAAYRYRPKSDAVSTSCAVYGNFLIVATSFGAMGVVFVQWIDLTTGTVVTTHEWSPLDPGTFGCSYRECKIVVAGVYLVIAFHYVDDADSNHKIGFQVFDGSDSFTYVSSTFAVGTLNSSTPSWDIAEVRGSTGRFGLAWYNSAGFISCEIYDDADFSTAEQSQSISPETAPEGIALAVYRAPAFDPQLAALCVVNSGGTVKLYTCSGNLAIGWSNPATIGTGTTLAQGPITCEIWSYGIGWRVCCAVTGDISPTGYTSPIPCVWLSRWTIAAHGATPTQLGDEVYRVIWRAGVAGRLRDQMLWCQYSRAASQQRQYLLYAIITGPVTASNQDLLRGGPLVARCGWRTAGGVLDATQPLSQPVVYGEDLFWPSLEVYDGELSVASGAENRKGVVVWRYSQKDGKRAPTAEIAGLQVLGGSHRCVDGEREIMPPYCYPDAENTWCTGDGAGSLSGTVYYKIVYVAYDSRGNVWRSAPSSTIEEGGLSSNSVVLRIEGYGMQEDAPLGIEVYRQHTDGTFRLAEKGTVASTGYATITDAGASLSSRPLLYTTGGEPEVFPTPPSDVCAVWNGRLWVASDDQLYYSHQYDYADGASTGPHMVESFRLQFSSRVTALAALDTMLLVFTASEIYVLSGDGPNRLGQGAYTQSSLTKLSSEVGCVDWRSVATYRDGVAFQSSRGLELIPRGGGAPQPFGDPVSDVLAAYNEVSSAVVVAEHDQIRWTLVTPGGANSTGAIVVYDYGEGQWLTETAPSYDDAILWLGDYVLSGAGAPVLNEYEGGIWTQGGRWTDHKPAGNVAYTAYVETGDIHPAGLRGWCRVARIEVLGTASAAASITISIAYNGSTSFGETGTVAWTSGSVIQQEHAPAYGKFESIRVKLSDSSTTEGAALHAIVLHAQVKHGGGRLPSARRT